MFDYDLERRLAPICIDRERLPLGNYGTKTHTIILVDNQDRVEFIEVDRYRSSESLDIENGSEAYVKGHFEERHSFRLSQCTN